MLINTSQPFALYCLLAYIHTYIHLKHENGDKWYKNGG